MSFLVPIVQSSYAKQYCYNETERLWHDYRAPLKKIVRLENSVNALYMNALVCLTKLSIFYYCTFAEHWLNTMSTAKVLVDIDELKLQVLVSNERLSLMKLDWREE